MYTLSIILRFNELFFLRDVGTIPQIVGSTVIPRLTSDPANDFFRLIIFSAVFWTLLTNVLVDARANIKQQT